MMYNLEEHLKHYSTHVFKEFFSYNTSPSIQRDLHLTYLFVYVFHKLSHIVTMVT